MLIENCFVYTNGAIRRENVSVEGSIIGEIGAKKSEEQDVIDGSGFLITPGMRNLHMHASTSLIRGSTQAMPLDQWVSTTLWKYECGISQKEAYYGSLYSICQMLKNGITYFEDMHFFEQEVAKACVATGIRASLSEALMDMAEWENPKATPKSTVKLAKETHKSSLVSTKMGIVSVRLSSEDLIDECTSLFEEHKDYFSGYHLHNSEVSKDVEFSKRTYGMSPTAFFSKKGVLGPSTTAAHCIYITEDDMELLSSSHTVVAHCIASNFRLASGVAPINDMLFNGIDIGMGIDSPAINDGFDISSDARMAGLVHNLEPYQILRILFGSTGIRPGMAADILFIDIGAFFPKQRMEALLAFTDIGRHVVHVMVDGVFVVKDSEVLGVDEKEVSRRAEAAAANVWSRLEK